ncbi:hypothetical protein Bhyg_05786 [Pseudolycoriella hygida]|uniref:Uncharacterized protein n=1 Tax=Pseudolycoriella hygida TaxID=35572 RepID=A0A9Q0MZI9_9DIPT|nr:hypothetical protein Bhyg_05786 [Pseudolycoriella hygida]
MPKSSSNKLMLRNYYNLTKKCATKSLCRIFGEGAGIRTNSFTIMIQTHAPSVIRLRYFICLFTFRHFLAAYLTATTTTVFAEQSPIILYQHNTLSSSVTADNKENDCVPIPVLYLLFVGVHKWNKWLLTLYSEIDSGCCCYKSESTPSHPLTSEILNGCKIQGKSNETLSHFWQWAGTQGSYISEKADQLVKRRQSVSSLGLANESFWSDPTVNWVYTQNANRKKNPMSDLYVTKNMTESLIIKDIALLIQKSHCIHETYSCCRLSVCEVKLNTEEIKIVNVEKKNSLEEHV